MEFPNKVTLTHYSFPSGNMHPNLFIGESDGLGKTDKTEVYVKLDKVIKMLKETHYESDVIDFEYFIETIKNISND